MSMALAAVAACATAAQPSSELLRSWMRIDDENAAPHFPTIAFERNRVSGYSGCNRFFADVHIDGSEMRFGPLGATRMACAEPSMATERALFGALERTRRWRLANQELSLLDAQGAEIARFTPAD